MKDVSDHAAERRAEAIRSLGIMDSEDEADFDEITAFAAEITGAPISLVTLVDIDRQWAKSAFGTDQRDYSMDESICSHGLAGPEFFEIPDTTADARTMSNPLVTGPEAIRYYGGAILRIGEEVPVGALCILDRTPRALPAETKRLLVILARQVARRMELRRALSIQETLAAEVDHRVKNSLQMVAGLVRIQRAQAQSPETRDALDQTVQRLTAIATLHAELHKVSARNAIALDRFLPDILGHLEPTLPPGIALDHALAPLTVPSEIAASLALIVNEAVTNAAKHAFPAGAAGRIWVRLSLQGGAGVLEIADDGAGGARAATPAPQGAGLGRRIIDASVSRVTGEIARRSDATGTVLAIRFPVPRG